MKNSCFYQLYSQSVLMDPIQAIGDHSYYTLIGKICILKNYPQTSFFYVYQHQQPKCLICEQSFTNMVSTIQHTHVHAERRLSCTLCRIICRGRYELQEHTKKCHVTVSLSTKPKVSPKKLMETSASTSADILCCPVCLDYYDVEEEYEEHIKTHFSNSVSGGF